jgi:hypothetical protein
MSFSGKGPKTLGVDSVPPIPFRMQLLWHERTHADEGAHFFRSLILAVVRAPRAREEARLSAWPSRQRRT